MNLVREAFSSSFWTSDWLPPRVPYANCKLRKTTLANKAVTIICRHILGSSQNCRAQNCCCDMWRKFDTNMESCCRSRRPCTHRTLLKTTRTAVKNAPTHTNFPLTMQQVWTPTSIHIYAKFRSWNWATWQLQAAVVAQASRRQNIQNRTFQNLVSEWIKNGVHVVRIHESKDFNIGVKSIS